jgi:hypothetical protein
MRQIENLNIQYITDENGKKTAVIIPITQFEELLEDIEDLKSIGEREGEETTSHEDLIVELKTMNN